MAGLKPSTKYEVVVRITVHSLNNKNYVRESSTAYMTTASAAAVKVSEPYSLKASTAATSVSAAWDWEDDFIGKQPTYTVTLKQGAKTVKTVTTSEVSQKFTGLMTKTGYTVLVKSNGASLNGKKKVSTSSISLGTKTK